VVDELKRKGVVVMVVMVMVMMVVMVSK